MNRALLAAVLLCFVAASARAQSPPGLGFGLDLDGTALTDFGSYFSLPVGAHVGAEIELTAIAPGLSVSAGGYAGWWMESFRDMFHFHPELLPVMIPMGGNIGLLWEPNQTLVVEAGVQVGIILELAPGARPTILLFLCPGMDIRWFFADPVGAGIRVGWAWMGADPIWNGLAVQAGPVVR